MTPTRTQIVLAEFGGSAALLCAVVGSGIMADRLSGGNVAIALLANTMTTGCALVVLITMLGPISGAHGAHRRRCFPILQRPWHAP
jgi:glycerol uptake facilitator-like aquaporin